MKRTPFNDPDDAVEITSLDAPATQEHAYDTLLQGSRLAPKVRTWLTILSVLAGIFLIVIVLPPLLPSLLPKKASTPPKPYLPPAQIQDVTVQDGIAYITSSDGTLRALRVQNGSLLWQHNSVSIAPLFINNTIYIVYSSQKSAIIQALRVKEGTVLWSFKAPLGVDPLIIDNGTAYSLNSFSSQPERILAALDSRNGAELWHYTMPIVKSQFINIQGIQDKVYISSLPDAQVQNTDLVVLSVHTGLPVWHISAENVQVMPNNVVFTVTGNGVLKVLRADNGHEAWQYKSMNGSNWSPLSGTNLFYVQTPAGLLQALNMATGAIEWAYKDPWGVAEIFPEIDGIVYLETGDGFIVALPVSDGARLWHVRPVAPPFTFGLVQVINDIVYTFTSVGITQYETVVALNANDGSLLWRRKIDTNNNYNYNYVIPQVSNDLFLADSGSVITALRAHNGTVLWHMNYTPSISRYNFGLLTLTNGMVLIRSSDSVLEAHQAGTGALLWRYHLEIHRKCMEQTTYYSLFCEMDHIYSDKKLLSLMK